MRKIYIILTIILLSTILFSEKPNSMRYISTSGIFSDSWEDVYDPIDLNNIDKLFFFTSLSDFTSDYNDELGEITGDSDTKLFEEFPFGIAFRNPYIKNANHALFFRWNRNKTPGYAGNGYYGEFEEFTTEYTDTNNDGIIDNLTQTESTGKSSYDDDIKFDFIFNNSIELDGKKFGFKFSSYNTETIIDNSQSDMGDYYFGAAYGTFYLYNGYYSTRTRRSVFDNDTNELMYTTDSNGKFNTEVRDSKQSFVFSMERGCCMIANSTMRFDLGIDYSGNLSRDTDDNYTASYKQIVIKDTIEVYGNLSETYQRKIDYSNTDIYFKSELSKELTSFIDSKFNFGIKLGLVVGEKTDEYYSKQVINEYADSLLTGIYDTEEKYYLDEYTRNGDNMGFLFDTFTKFDLPLNDFARFGMSGTLKFRRITGEYKYDRNILQKELEFEGLELDEAEEFSSITESNTMADLQTVTTSTHIKIPTALEFSIPKTHLNTNDGFSLRNFVFRIGTEFNYHQNRVEDTYNLTKYEAPMTITESGTGEISESHATNIGLSSDKEIRETIDSYKIYTAGIGYKHSENVSIDFASKYYDQTDEYYFGLSFTICR